MSIDENGMCRLEKLSFDAYNESEVLIGAIESYRKRTGHYPKRVLADTIYRNRVNLSYCKAHGIRMSGLALGRPKKDNAEDKKRSYQDSVDRIEVERGFSLTKRCYGLGLIWTKLDTTTRSSIALSIIAMNVDRLAVYSFAEFLVSVFQCTKPDIRWYPWDYIVLRTGMNHKGRLLSRHELNSIIFPSSTAMVFSLIFGVFSIENT